MVLSCWDYLPFVPMFTEAEGYAELGMFMEAWECLEDFPAVQRSHPEALRVRLQCCTGLERWELGEDLARIVGEFSNPLRFREVAGRFHLAHARHLAEAGKTTEAKEQVRIMARSWPEGRLTVLDDSTLGELF